MPLIRTGQREGVPPDAVGPLPWGMAPGGVTADESSCERHTNTGESWQYIASRTSAGAPRPPGVSGRERVPWPWQGACASSRALLPDTGGCSGHEPSTQTCHGLAVGKCNLSLTMSPVLSE